MTYWPFWLGAVFLAAVPVLHWFLLSKMFAVSGRISAITDWLRGVRVAPAPDLAEDEMIRLLRAETEAAFGADACGAESYASEEACGAEAQVVSGASGAVSTTTPPATTLTHLLFLVCVALGGTLAYWQATGTLPHATGPDASFQHFFGEGTLTTLAVLFGGGLLVGFGTRMAGGCTSGHGLCGVSRLQPGSLVATACFFGCGIAVSFVLEALVRR